MNGKTPSTGSSAGMTREISESSRSVSFPRITCRSRPTTSFWKDPVASTSTGPVQRLANSLSIETPRQEPPPASRTPGAGRDGGRHGFTVASSTIALYWYPAPKSLSL